MKTSFVIMLYCIIYSVLALITVDGTAQLSASTIETSDADFFASLYQVIFGALSILVLTLSLLSHGKNSR